MSPKKSHTNKLLITELKNGNEKAFRKLFELFWEPMFIRAKLILLDENIAKDIVQNIWVNIWQQRKSKEILNFKAYVFKAVNNGCYKYLRDNTFSKTQLLVIESLPSPWSSKPSIEKQYDLEETELVIEKSLRELPSRCQQIFKLSRIDEVSNEEIASQLGITKRSVENQISLALKSIRLKLSDIQYLLLSLLLPYF